MQEFHVWITALTKSYEPELTSRLLNRGYTLTASSSAGKVNTDTYNSVPLFALKVSKNGATSATIYDDISVVLLEMKAYYYSLIISEASDQARWTSTNINFQNPFPSMIQQKTKEIN